MLTLRSSGRLATAYGLAVAGTFVITTTLFLIVAATVWRWPTWKLIAIGVGFGVVEIAYGSGDTTGLMRWRKRLFIGLAHNAANPQQPPSACPTSARS